MKALIIFLVSKCLSRCLDFCELSAMTAAYWNRNCGTKNWKILSPLEEPLGDPNLKTPHPEIQHELLPEVRNFGSNILPTSTICHFLLVSRNLSVAGISPKAPRHGSQRAALEATIAT